ncbi:hypothetical protein Leryth_020657 [Lithospermum erythrorhizon]|nr:hypothetical protein Leryth_020657 [Lithospermum erythrorhizon]
MGSGRAADVEPQQHSDEIKVHHLMCTELNKWVRSVSKILPEIEAACPGCSGIDALCSLISARDKVQSLLQQCRDSSKLYMALTGDIVLKRCIKSRNLLEQSLTQIQNTVPVMLAAKISRVVVDIKGARFGLDPSEMMAGKVLKELLHKNGSHSDVVEEFTSQAIQVAALKLHISSQTALLIEKRSIKKLLDGVSAGDSTKKKILYFFLKLLEKYGKLIVEGQKKNGFMLENHFMDSNSSVLYTEVQSCDKQEPQGPRFDILSQPVPPDEFICPLSLKVMHTPVVIASGETFERMWIQKWFDEGNDICPKTGKRLVHLTLTPNASMKDLIAKWCSANGVTITDPNIQHPLDSSYTSVASLTSSLNGLSLPMHSSSFSSTLASTTYSLNNMTTKAGDDSLRFCSDAHESVCENILKLDSLPRESQLSVVESMLRLLNADDHQLECMQYENFIHPLLRFLKRANDLHDVQSKMCGCRLLLASVKKYSTWISYFDDDAYDLLASFINSDVVKEALLIWEALSRDELSRSRVGESSARVYILRMLESQTSEFHELLLNIVCNVSEDDAICSFLISSDIIPKLVPFFEHTTLAGYCARILKNMCDKEAAKVSIANTDGCISSLARLLESGSLEIQEHVVAVLLSLCSQRNEYCQMVLEEGVVPSLCSICINGNDKGKMMATELLRLLDETSNSDGERSESNSDPRFTSNNNTKESNNRKELKSPSKAPRYLRRMLDLFKSSPTSARKKGEK